jgi:RNA polymerase sigma-70 factor (ECF subfamily)
MTPAASDAIAIARVLDAVMREDRGRLLSALIARLGDFQMAEDALQDAAASALVHWGRAGVPDRPVAWLIRVAFRKAIDAIRQQQRSDANSAALCFLARDEAMDDPEAIPDERLRLIFTCCHPALEPKTQVALTLRTLGGLGTGEIAAAFLDNEPAMGQRLSRAKAKIAAAGIPFAVPGPEDLAGRLGSVLTVCYLIFNAGYTLGPLADRDLCNEAIFLARLINSLRPNEAEVEGCLSLMLLTHARKAARTDASGMTVTLPDQDRSLWDGAMIDEGRTLLRLAYARHRPGPFQIKAAIAALHGAEGLVDRAQILALYDALVRFEPTPVVRLNRAVALAETGSTQVALGLVEHLAADLADYQPFHATRAELLARLGRVAESKAAFDRAIVLAVSPSDALFLGKRKGALYDLQTNQKTLT